MSEHVLTREQVEELLRNPASHGVWPAALRTALAAMDDAVEMAKQYVNECGALEGPGCHLSCEDARAVITRWGGTTT